MNLSELVFSYPDSLIATKPEENSRILWVPASGDFSELNMEQLIGHFKSGDLLVINDTKVLKRRVFTQEGFEILFIKQLGQLDWEVLFPSSRLEKGQTLILPANVKVKLTQGGRPQIVTLSEPLSTEYFDMYGELPLPPYIQRARAQRNQMPQDNEWYQPSWAEKPGSLASPTASLHFKPHHLALLKAGGVDIAHVTLHVGLGTFLPISAKNIAEHVMHEEICTVPNSTWHRVIATQAAGRKIWALGTTVVRALESRAVGQLQSVDNSFEGSTKLFIYPGFQFQVVERLLTNFHQPHTTLLALVAAFAGEKRWKKAYDWAIGRNFRLFSYGDMTAWERSESK